MNIVQRTWRHQAGTEYRAAGRVAELCHWLVVLGSSPDTLERFAAAIADEVRHSADSHALFLRVGGEESALALDMAELVHHEDPGAPLHLRALSALGDLAVEESLSVEVFKLRRRNATDPVALEVVTSILRDEARHRALAWDAMEELIERIGVDVARAWSRPRLASWMAASLGARLEEVEPVYSPEELAFGLIDRREHWAVMRAALRDDVLPSLRRLGLLEDGATVEGLAAELAPGRG